MPAGPCTGALRRKLPTGRPSMAKPSGHKSPPGVRNTGAKWWLPTACPTPRHHRPEVIQKGTGRLRTRNTILVGVVGVLGLLVACAGDPPTAPTAPMRPTSVATALETERPRSTMVRRSPRAGRGASGASGATEREHQNVRRHDTRGCRRRLDIEQHRGGNDHQFWCAYGAPTWWVRGTCRSGRPLGQTLGVACRTTRRTRLHDPKRPSVPGS